MVFLIINSIDILEEHQNVDGDHDTFVERFHEDVIDPRSHQVKKNDEARGYWNHRYDTNLKSSLLFKAK